MRRDNFLQLIFLPPYNFHSFHTQAGADSFYSDLSVHGVLCQGNATGSCYVFVKAPLPSAHLDLPRDCKLELALSLFTWPLI